MNSQEYDRLGRLSKEDELMMIKPTSNLSCDKDAPEPSVVMVRNKSFVRGFSSCRDGRSCGGVHLLVITIDLSLT